MRSPKTFEPKIVAFCCHYCAYSSADLAGSMRIQYPPNVRIIRTPCTGRLETEFFMKAFENGADGVLVAGCLEGGCHFVEGNLCAKRRVNYTRDAGEIGLEKERIPHGQRFRRLTARVLDTITNTGRKRVPGW
jgi:coenzyme F420-reducing hydrogenase delta subunit